MLDMRGNGFAVHTGWVGAQQGILVLQQAGQGGTPTIAQMFGGPGAEGFAALAAYDSNGDGVIDANDAIYAQLRIWVDANGSGTVDSGELETLQQAGIASINLASTAQTGTFTRTDGTTGTVDDVSFNVDTFHSKYLGNSTVSAAAAAMPELKGYGTLTNLRVAMTLDPTLIDTINANLPNLNTPDLATLRAAALPMFVAWAKAVKLPDANGNLQVIDPAGGIPTCRSLCAQMATAMSWWTISPLRSPTPAAPISSSRAAPMSLTPMAMSSATRRSRK
jgi:EF hand